MTTNVGTIDRIIRALVGIVLIALPFATSLTAGSALLTYGSVAVGVVMLGVALTRVCPVYSIFGWKTCA
jgi:hypothetical protein